MHRWILCLLILFVSAHGGWAAEKLMIDSPMWTDPECKLAEVVLHFPEGLLPLWKKALEYKDSELQRTSADTIAVAQQRGMEGLDSLKNRLVEMVKSPDFDRVVRRSAINALVSLQARDQAELLAQVAATDGPEVAQIVEPALAKWGYGALKDQWLARLDDAAAPAIARRLAIECLATTGEKSAEPKLLKLAEDPHANIMLRVA